MELGGNNRINFGKSNTLIYRPDKRFQLIIGINGSGKSSLGEELNVMPINKENYSKSGYKKILVFKNNHYYYIEYTLQKCIMIKDPIFSNASDIGRLVKFQNSETIDGDNLNKGGTKTIQLQLIKDIFGITTTIVDLLNNRIKFTNTSTRARKDLFNKIGILDIDYAIEFVNKARSVDNFRTTYIKKLTNDKNKLMFMYNEKEHTAIKEELNKIDDILRFHTELLKNSTHISRDTFVKMITEQLSKFENYVIQPVSEIEHFDNKIMGQLSSIKKNYIELSDQKDTLNKDLARTNSSSMALIEQEIGIIVGSFPKGVDIGQLELYTEILNTIEDRLMVSPVTRNIISEHIRIGKTDIDRLDNNLIDIRSSIALNGSKIKKITCVKCGTINEYNESMVQLDRLHQEETNIKIRRKESIDKYNLGVNTINVLFEDIRDNDILSIFNTDRRDLLINTLSTTITNRSSLVDKYKEIDEILSDNDNTTRVSRIKSEIKEITNKMYIVEQKSNNLKAELERSKYILEQRNNYINLIDMATKTVLEYELQEIDRVIDVLIKKDIEKLIRQRAELNEQFIIVDNIKRDIDSVSKKIEETIVEKKVTSAIYIEAKTAVDNLMTSSLDYIVGKINKTLSDIWAYDIKLDFLSSGISDDDFKGINYEFPFTINGVYRGDVSKGSTSMKDIINLAFKLTVMELLDLNDYPIILDEFGSSMDEVHSDKIYSNINNILDVQNTGQIFIISHISNQSGAMIKLSDINVINKTGLTLPSVELNKCLKL